MDYISAKNNWEVFKKDFSRHPLKAVVIVIVVLTTLIYVFVIRSEKFSSETTQMTNPYPPFEIEYKKLEEAEQENGLYKTIFEIIVTRPQGNFYEEHSISYDRNKMDCSLPDWKKTEAGEVSGRQVYEKNTYNASCVSEKSIVDNGKLFGVRPKEVSGE